VLISTGLELDDDLEAVLAAAPIHHQNHQERTA